jgi:hypothetical protein
VADGSNPPICFIHAKGSQSPIIPPPEQIDELKVLKQLARNSDPRIRLRAVDLLISLRTKDEKGCARCAEHQAQDDEARAVAARANDDQSAQLRVLMAEARALIAVILAQPATREVDVASEPTPPPEAQPRAPDDPDPDPDEIDV